MNEKLEWRRLFEDGENNQLNAENTELYRQLEQARTRNLSLHKLLEDANRGAERNAHVNQLLAADLLKVTRERGAWRKLVLEHNAECKRLCVSGEAYCHVIDSYSGCVTCPECYEITMPPELEQSS